MVDRKLSQQLARKIAVKLRNHVFFAGFRLQILLWISSNYPFLHFGNVCRENEVCYPSYFKIDIIAYRCDNNKDRIIKEISSDS